MTRKLTKRTPEEVEAYMVPKLVTILYPVLIPFEQQDCAIQARNQARITEIAQQVWRSFSNGESRDG
jgi:hypothetical protein